MRSPSELLSSQLPLFSILSMTKLRAWVKKNLRLKQSSQKQSADQLPFLPSPRRSITPTTLSTPGCPFFQLPGDIRSMILTMAFGGHILHVDVVRQEEAWQWRGIICSRRMQKVQPLERYLWRGPWQDNCTNRRYGWHEEFPENHSFGIMGFLLSCKQAYTEGLEFLYSANSISIQSETLLVNLPQLISPNRLACIKTLEIVIRAHCVQQDNDKPTTNRDHLKPILDNIVTHCNQIRSFCLSFISAEESREEILTISLPLVDSFYRATRLRNMRVELPLYVYVRAGVRKTICDHVREAPAKARWDRSLWRCLDTEEPVVQDRCVQRYPYPPLKLPVLEDRGDDVESAGYWLAEADEGPYNPARVVCF